MANQGFHHPTYNPNGSKLASDGKKWYETTVSFTSIADCFTESKLQVASGYIGTTSARADGIFYDQVHEGDITDLRMSSQKVEDYNRLIDREFNKAVTGTVRGSEGEWVVSQVLTLNATYSAAINAFTTTALYYPFSIEGLVGSGSGAALGVLLPTTFIGAPCFVVDSVGVTRIGLIFVTGGNTFLRVNGTFTTGTITISVLNSTTRTKSNTLTHCDIIGSPANYPTAWKQSGVSGVPLIVAEDGTSLLPTGTTGSDGLATFKLSRKANATPLQVLKSTDSGVTWTALTVTTHYTFNTTTNAITFTAGNIPLVAHLIRITYQTHTIMATPTVNSEVLAIGDVYGTTFNNPIYGATLNSSLLGKVPVGAISSRYSVTTALMEYQRINIGLLYSLHGVPISHNNLDMAKEITPAVKVFPYLTRSNGKAYLNLVFKEMKYNGASWGDDSKFNIVDNVSTTTDNNAQTVLIGQKRIELPYFIGAAE